MIPENNYSQIGNAIGNAKSILLTSHLSPDPDAICSLLLLTKTLALNFPDIQIYATLEDDPNIIEGLEGIEIVHHQSLDDAVRHTNPDLIIVTDTNRLSRVSRIGSNLLQELVSKHVKTVVIDHHDETGKDSFDIELIDDNIPAATQMVYEICFNKLSYEKPDSFAKLTMLGIVADTGGLRYGGKDYTVTKKIIEQLTSEGVNIESAEKVLNRLNPLQESVVKSLTKNFRVELDYSFSFLDDAIRQKWKEENQSPGAFKAAKNIFINNSLAGARGKNWGFCVTPSMTLGDGHYDVSFRSLPGTVNVAMICQKINDGGGHENAAGTSIEASTIEEALDLVKQAIKMYR